MIRSVILSVGTTESRPASRIRATSSERRCWPRRPRGGVSQSPVGRPAAERADRFTRRQLFAAGEMMGIEVMDHIILGDDEVFQLQGRGEAVKVLLRLFRGRGGGHDPWVRCSMPACRSTS